MTKAELISAIKSLNFRMKPSRQNKVKKKPQESEEKYLKLVEAAFDAIFIANTRTGIIIFTNKRAGELTGIPVEEMVGKHHIQLYPPEDIERYKKLFKKYAQIGKGITSEEIFIQHKDGRKIPVEISTSVFKLSGSNVMQGIFRDITKRKRIEDELRKSKKMLDDAQRIAHMGSWNWNVVKNESTCSDEIYRIRGLKPQQYHLVFEKFIDLVHPDDLEFVKKSVTAALYERKAYNINFLVIRPDGSHRIVHSEAEVTFDETGKPLNMIGIEQDITEHKLLEKALYESEKKYKELTEHMRELVYVADATTLVATYVNKAVEQMYGYTQKEWLSDNKLWGKRIHPDDFGRVISQFKEAHKDEKDIVVEYRIITKDGKTKWVEDRVLWRKDEKENISEINGIMIDITDRKLSEDKLRVKNSYLELLQITATSANEAVEIKEAFQPILEEICNYTGWEIGQAYVISKDEPNLLEPTNVNWLKDHKRFKGFCDVSKEIKFAKGIGLPGRVLASGQPHWIIDVTKDKNFIRKKIAKALNIKSGIAFPVMVDVNVVAVLEFYTTDILKPDQQFLDIMAYVGKQLGRVVERKWAEEMLQKQSKVLEQKNAILRELLGQIGRERKQIEYNVIANAENLLLPIIQKLKQNGGLCKYVQLLQISLKELTSSFSRKLTEKETKLTSREIEICSMIKNGFTSKEITSLLNIALRTTEKHRAHIRNKLGIINKGINLTSFLKTL